MRARRHFPAFGRVLALAVTALVLLATSVPTCIEEDRGAFDADTTCGPPGVVTLSYRGAEMVGCGSGLCWALVEAEGAGAVGLPEVGEINPEWDPPRDPEGAVSAYPPGAVFAAASFALLGEAPVAGATPPSTVRRLCRAAPSSTSGVVEIACSSEAPQAACGGTLTLRPAAP